MKDMNWPGSLIILLCIWTLLTGCQHFRKPDQRPGQGTGLPQPLKGYFGACFPSDGEVSLRWYKNKSLLLDTRSDWVSSDGGWRLQLTDLVGRMLLDAGWDRRRLRISGAVREGFPEISVGDTGFLELKGHITGLKAQEIPCLLRGKFPVSWLAQPYKTTGSAAKARYLIREQERRISLTEFDPDNPQKQSVCATLTWKNLWGLKSSSLLWCVEKNGLSGYLRLPEENQMIWKNSDA